MTLGTGSNTFEWEEVGNASLSHLDNTGAAFIVVGFVMAAVCIIGFISAWKDRKTLLDMVSRLF